MRGPRPELGAARVTVEGIGKEEDAEQSRVAKLLDGLGGTGKIKISRIDAEGREHFVEHLQVDDALTENLEGTIGERWGGGRYLLRGYVKGGKYISCATIGIDEIAFPPKKSEAEKAREAREGRAPAGVDPMSLMTLLHEQQQRSATEMRSFQLEAQKAQTQLIAVMLQLSDNQSARTVQMMQALRAPAAPGADPLKEGIAQVTTVARLLESLGYSKPGELPHAPAESSVAERVLTAAMPTLAQHVGPVLAKAFQPAPSPPAPSVPPLGQAAAGQVPLPEKEPERVVPPKPAAAKPGPKARLLSKEEIAERRAAREAARAGAQTVMHEVQTPAPPAAKVEPPKKAPAKAAAGGK